MVRPSDAIKVARSYVVFDDKLLGLMVKSSHWEVGYTPAHCASPEEAIDFALEQAKKDMVKAQAHVIALEDYKAHMGGSA